MKIIETRHWDVTGVSNMLIRENLYTMGTVEDYRKMYEIVSDNPFPTLDDIYCVAEDINRHSEDQTVTNIMFMLANDVIKSCFDIED